LSFYNKCVLWNLGTGDADGEFDQGGIAHFAPDGSSVLIYGLRDAKRYEIATGKLVESIQGQSFGVGFKSRFTEINAHLANEEQYDASATLIYNAEESNYVPILDAATGK